AITGWFFYTLVNEIQIYNWLAIKPENLSAMPLMLELPTGIRQLNDQTLRYYYSIEGYLPYITAIYVAGLLFNTTKLALTRKKINTIRKTMSIDIELQHKVTRFTKMLGIDKSVKIGLSGLVEIPCMTGYFKPVILLPFTLATYLSADEIEAILLHELAHIKRNDYLINLLQQVIAILLFFNPCIQLINRIINEERENCCDDQVVNATANPLIYAKALLKLEQTRQNDQQLALAATGKKYHLLNRIERIMKTKKETTGIRPALLAMLILTIGIGCIALLNPQIAEGKISIKSISPVISTLLSDTSNKATLKKPKHLAKNQATKKSYHVTGENHYNPAEADKKLEELSAEVQRDSEELSKYYSSEDFKATQRELEQKGKEMQEFYNNPELKRLQEEMGKASGDFSKNWGENDKQNDLTAKMGETGRKIGAYFSSPEFKKMNEELEKKYGIPHGNHYYNDNDIKDEKYKKYQAELDSKLPPEIRQQTEQLKKMGEQLSSRYESSEFKEQSLRMRALGDSLKRAFDNPAFKEQQLAMEKLGKQMSELQNSPKLKRETELLEQSVKKMNTYMKSAAYRLYLDQLKFNYENRFKFNYDLERPEKPEKPEKPEAPEKAGVSGKTRG
ncbi:MAG: M56 family metallopeptidase, partial [Sphingobacteriales bacterium]